MSKTKLFSRIAALLLSIIITMGLCATTMISVSASEANPTLTIHKLSSGAEDAATETHTFKADDGKFYKPIAGVEYTLYKIGTFQQDNGATSAQIVYTKVPGLNVDLNMNTDPDEIITTGLESKTSDPSDAAEGKIVFEGLDKNAVYLVKETKTPAGVKKANNFIITVPMYLENEEGELDWIYDITAYPKNTDSKIAIDKNVTGGIQIEEINNVEYMSTYKGATLNYQLDVTLPSDAVEDEENAIVAGGYTKFLVTDTPGADLFINAGSIEVLYKGVDISDDINVKVTYAVDGDTTSRVVKVEFDFFDGDDWADFGVENGGVVTIKYTAKVAPDATGTEITNAAKIDYETEDGEEPGTETPEPPPVVHLNNFNAQKVSEELIVVDEASETKDNKPLAGAVFLLSKDEEVAGETVTYYWGYNSTDGWVKTDSRATAEANTMYQLTSGADGYIKIVGVEYGAYKLTEIVAPEDHSLLLKPVEITINKTSTDISKQPSYSIRIINTQAVGGGLPSTGGAGIYMFLLIGGALMVVSVVMFAKNRKNKNRA